jgi:ribonuclease HII
VPTLREERRLLREGHLLVAGMDEVGRGALAGPVTVGVVVIDATIRTAPSGVRDSKLLTPAARQALVPRLRRWSLAHAVGHAAADEIDRYGIIAALRLAGRRALATLPQLPTCVLLDGSHDWLSPPRPAGRGLGVSPADAWLELDLGLPPSPPPSDPVTMGCREPAPEVPLPYEPHVLTMIKADLRCAAVAAASVLAKVERDSIMVRLAEDHPRYGWRENKGYSAPEHLTALAEAGPCDLHRQSWSLPRRAEPGTDPLFDLELVVPSEPEPAYADLDGVFDEDTPNDDTLDDEALDDEALDDEPLDDEPLDDENPDDEGGLSIVDLGRVTSGSVPAS